MIGFLRFTRRNFQGKPGNQERQYRLQLVHQRCMSKLSDRFIDFFFRMAKNADIVAKKDKQRTLMSFLRIKQNPPNR